MSRSLGKKMNKRVRTENSVQAYACVCVCDCVCSCGVLHGGVSSVALNRITGQAVTDHSTNIFN